MKRPEAEIIVAVALWQAGAIGESACEFRVERAKSMPEFRCQNPRSWRCPPARSRCACGAELKREFGPCMRCREEHDQMYLPNGRRRVFGLSEYE